MGATGFSTKSGITTPDFREASKKRIVMENSQSVYVLVDSSKYRKSALCKAFELAQCTLIPSNQIEDLDGLVEYIDAHP